MAGWKKLLARIASDPRPLAYTYDELAGLLVNHLGFTLAKPTDGSHRRFRRTVRTAKGDTTVTIGLVAPGRQKPEYVKQLVQTLRANDLLPDGVE